MTNRFKCNGAMEPHEHGGYVLHADYKQLHDEYMYVVEYLLNKFLTPEQLDEASEKWSEYNERATRGI